MASCKSSCECVGLGVGVFGFVLLHPIIGLVAQPILAIKAIYHRIVIQYHSYHSKNDDYISLYKDFDENGRIKYLDANASFAVEDLVLLQNEQKRLEHVEKLNDTLKKMRGLAKCIIPVFGLVWAASTELRGNGSMPMACSNCENHESHWTQEDAVKHHIQKIKINNVGNPICS